MTIKKKIIIGSAAFLGLAGIVTGITVPLVLNNNGGGGVVEPSVDPTVPVEPTNPVNPTDPTNPVNPTPTPTPTPTPEPTPGPVVGEMKKITVRYLGLDNNSKKLLPFEKVVEVKSDTTFISENEAEDLGLKISFIGATAKAEVDGVLRPGFYVPNNDGGKTTLKYYLEGSDTPGFAAVYVNGTLRIGNEEYLDKCLNDKAYYESNPQGSLYPMDQIKAYETEDSYREFLCYKWTDKLTNEERVVDLSFLKETRFQGYLGEIGDSKEYAIPEITAAFSEPLLKDKTISITTGLINSKLPEIFKYKGRLDETNKGSLRLKLEEIVSSYTDSNYQLLGFIVDGSETPISLEELLALDKINTIEVSDVKLEAMVAIRRNLYNLPLGTEESNLDPKRVLLTWKNGSNPVFDLNEYLINFVDEKGFNYSSDGKAYNKDALFDEASIVPGAELELTFKYYADFNDKLRINYNEMELIQPDFFDRGYFGLANKCYIKVPFTVDGNVDEERLLNTVLNYKYFNGQQRLRCSRVDKVNKALFFEITPDDMEISRKDAISTFSLNFPSITIATNKSYSNVLNEVDIVLETAKTFKMEAQEANIYDLVIDNDNLGFYNSDRINNVVLVSDVNLEGKSLISTFFDYNNDLTNVTLNLNGFVVTANNLGKALFNNVNGNIKNGAFVLKGLNRISNNRLTAAFANSLSNGAGLENVRIEADLGFNLTVSDKPLSTNYIFGYLEEAAWFSNCSINVNYNFNMSEQDLATRTTYYKQTNNYAPIGRIEGYYTQAYSKMQFPIEINVLDIKVSDYLKANKEKTITVDDGFLATKSDSSITERSYYDGVSFADPYFGEAFLRTDFNTYINEDKSLTYNLGRVMPTINMAVRSLSYDDMPYNHDDGSYKCADIKVNILNECDYGVTYEVFNHVDELTYKKGDQIIVVQRNELDNPYKK